ncbi:MAG: homocysteine S-methyltransferase family protein [Bacteroidales bacterium]|nr:homocysteine S-methyltransferase family protein [Bacteroidales bacterium]
MQKEELLKQLSFCVEKGKADRATPTPPELKDQDGAKEMMAGFVEQVRGLVDGGADAILIETMSDMDEARVAIRAARFVTDVEVMCTFTFTLTPANEYRTMMGTSPAEAVEMSAQIGELIRVGASIVGGCCGTTPEHILRIVQVVRG